MDIELSKDNLDKIYITYAIPYGHSQNKLICTISGLILEKSGMDKIYVSRGGKSFIEHPIVFDYSQSSPKPVEYIII